MRLFVTGSWYHRDKPIDIMDVLRAEGHEIVLDWTKEAHLSKPKKGQYDAILEAVRTADAVVASLEGYEHRMESATFYMIAAALFLRKRLIVMDPAKLTRHSTNVEGVPVHPAFNNLIGVGLYSDPCCSWVTTVDEVVDMLPRKTLKLDHNLPERSGGGIGCFPVHQLKPQ